MVSKKDKSSISSKLEMKKVQDGYQSLCRDLNMDASTTESAWASYQDIKQNYTLEGNQLHWLACSLFVACHNSNLSTVNEEGTVEGNGVSLTRLLRSCKLSLIQFFNKTKKWADMSNLKSQFRDKIDSLERNFAVSNVIFKKYQPIFVYLFKDPAQDPIKAPRSRKQKKPLCTPGEIFDFTWNLFVRVKTDFPAISDDLVNSYHLLLSCIDYIYGNAVLGKRTDLLNEKFDCGIGDFDKVTEPPCILDTLCRLYDGIISEVKSIREHWWRPHIKKFFDSKILRGDNSKLYGILDPNNFEINAKNIRRDYETHVLSIGEYDERVFLGEDANEEIGTPSKMTGPGGEIGDLNEKMVARRNLATQFDGSGLIPVTPLSGKHYLQAKEQLKITPVSTATYLVSRLNTLLGKREAGPSQKLRDLFSSCDNDPTERIKIRVKEMGDKFCSQYTAPNEKSSGSYDSFTRMRLGMGVVLYYKMLEGILVKEKSQNKPLNNLLSQDIFHQALFTCCLEIVIFSYNSQRTFPWILDTFNLEPIHFYKVIEIIIRTEDSLPRDVVKHLQRIEEQILESRAWTSESPLWESIAKDPQGVPYCEEVSLPGHSVPGGSTTPAEAFVGQSPLSHHKRHFQVIKSPMAGDRFKSPVVTAVARRQLAFGDNQIVPTSPVKAGQSLLASPQKAFVQLQGQNIPISSIKSLNDGKIVIQPPGEDEIPSKPKRTGSLALFFRKVYHLAHLRLDALCSSNEIYDEEVKRKIWTTFEHCLTNETGLMKDRHMDQLILCSLYMVCKVVKQERKFIDIVQKYREQPQANSHVYRSVLLVPKVIKKGNEAENSKKKASSAIPPPTPTRLAASSTIVDGEERGDLIKFYNTVFMEKLQNFSLKFKRSRQNDAPPLSPLPKLLANPQSPVRKVSESHSVYVSVLKSDPSNIVVQNPHSPTKPLSYSFSRSPAKDLKAINDVMRAEVERKSRVGKRLLADENGHENPGPAVKFRIMGPAGAVNTKLDMVMGDRPSESGGE